MSATLTARMKAVEVRPASPEEMLQLGALGAYVYAGSFGDEDDNVISQSNLPEWTTCAFLDGKLISSLTAIPFTMRANGAAVKLAGVSTVGTLPEYRRQGLSRRIITESMARMRADGQAVAALWASQAGIYQRYQYAAASIQRNYAIDVADIVFHDGDYGSADVARINLGEAFDRVKQVYIRFIADRMCYLHRSKALWQMNALEETPADGPIHIAMATTAAGDEGYIIYTVRSGRNDHRARSQEMKVRELVATTPDAYRSLWRFIAGHDLVGRVVFNHQPMDDPAFELIQEPRMLHAEDAEGIWLRIVDVEQALAERGYSDAGKLRITVSTDRLADWNAGTFELEADPNGAVVRRVDGPGDITLTPKSLASLYSGFRSARELHSWGLLEGDAAAADRVFATHHGPHSPDHF